MTQQVLFDVGRPRRASGERNTPLPTWDDLLAAAPRIDALRLRTPGDGCWWWLGGLTGSGTTGRGGYGRVALGSGTRRQMVGVHRAVLALQLGGWPVDHRLEASHLCHEQTCVRPLHIRAQDHRQNVAQSSAAGHYRGCGTRARTGSDLSIRSRKLRTTILHALTGAGFYHGPLLPLDAPLDARLPRAEQHARTRATRPAIAEAHAAGFNVSFAVDALRRRIDRPVANADSLQGRLPL